MGTLSITTSVYFAGTAKAFAVNTKDQTIRICLIESPTGYYYRYTAKLEEGKPPTETSHQLSEWSALVCKMMEQLTLN